MTPEEYRELAKALRATNYDLEFLAGVGLIGLGGGVFSSGPRFAIATCFFGAVIATRGMVFMAIRRVAEHMAEWPEKQEVGPALDPKEALEQFSGTTDLMRGDS